MIHKLSVVHENAQIGAGVTISPFVTIEEDVVIGEGCWIGPHATIMAGTRMGKNCKVFPGAIVGSIPQDLKFGGEHTTLEIGDDVVIREYCTLNRGTSANGATVIGSRCLFMAYVHVAHDCVIGDDCVLANNATLAGHVEVGSYAILSAMTAIRQFTRIGEHSMVGGGVLVNKDIPPFVRVARQPASYIGVNSIGLSRRGFDKETIHHIQDVYRYIFVKGMRLSRALDAIEENLQSTKEQERILHFINASEQGIIKGFQSTRD